MPTQTVRPLIDKGWRDLELVRLLKIKTAFTTLSAAKPFATKPKQRLRPGVGGPGSQEERVLCLA